VLELDLEVVRDGFTLDVRLALAPGPTALVGPNGAGKSTLLRAILGALPVRRGRIVLDGHILLDTEHGVSVPTEERRVAWVPQEYALFPHLTVLENVAFAGVASSWCALGRRAAEGRPCTRPGGRAPRPAPRRASGRAGRGHPGGDPGPPRREPSPPRHPFPGGHPRDAGRARPRGAGGSHRGGPHPQRRSARRLPRLAAQRVRPEPRHPHRRRCLKLDGIHPREKLAACARLRDTPRNTPSTEAGHARQSEAQTSPRHPCQVCLTSPLDRSSGRARCGCQGLCYRR
jgi:ABC-type sugar transport system ATPase subunit